MTRDEIMALKAGPELDALVAEKVMGWHLEPLANLPRWHWIWHRPDGKTTYDLPPYSTDIAEAWRVVEDYGHFFDAEWCPRGKEYKARARFTVRNSEHEVFADTMPLAICRAALLAVR